MFTCTAYGQESREQELKYELELDALDELWKELEMELGEYLPGFHWRDILGRMEEGQGAVGLSGLMGGDLAISLARSFYKFKPFREIADFSGNSSIA